MFGEDKFSSDIFEKYEIILFPHFEIGKLEDKSIDLFFNSHSLSEMESDTAKNYFNIIDRCSKLNFMHVNHDHTKIYDSINNKKFLKLSNYKLPSGQFKKVYKFPSQFNKEYFEYLYQRKNLC